ncbi:MAG TPA: murein biosynthesis integral membrane protein MurJ [Pyrinomonadaceae bacterium]|nr:murein biosynthesis integral membrane protein MurJ [Pyrinomonadaceae bacterium]
MTQDAGDEQQKGPRPTKDATREESAIVAGEENIQLGSVAGQAPAEQAAEVPEAKPPALESTRRGAFLVGAGILLSRIVGLIRQRVFAHYFGLSIAGDAYAAAFRIPNFLQNVFGEGALSASFIPVYAKLLAKGEHEEAGRVAGVIFSILALTTSVLVLVGVLAAPLLTDFLAPGFEGEKRDLTVQLVRIFFPGAGLLVISAWCLGVLNSHRRFFLSYTAPVIWNVAIIVALVLAGAPVFGRATPDDLGVWGAVARYTAWGAVVGSALQFSVQLPSVLRLVKGLRLSLAASNTNVRTVIRNFLPVFLSRGVVQISAFVDEMIASLLGNGPMQALTYTQSLYTLPVSLFGMAVSAAELPAMASAVGGRGEVSAQLRKRLDAGLRQISFFIVPSIVGFLALGDVMVAALYRTGNFDRGDVLYIWAILAGSAIGLLPTTLGRLYASAFYALHDTRTPFRFAVLHVVLAIGLGYVSAIYLPPLFGVEMRWGAVGLTASAGVAGWIEFIFLRRKLNSQIGRTGLGLSFVSKLWAAAILSAAVGWGLKLLVGGLHPIIVAALVLTPYGLLYFALTSLWGLPEARAVVGRFTRVLRLGRS